MDRPLYCKYCGECQTSAPHPNCPYPQEHRPNPPVFVDNYSSLLSRGNWADQTRPQRHVAAYTGAGDFNFPSSALVAPLSISLAPAPHTNNRKRRGLLVTGVALSRRRPFPYEEPSPPHRPHHRPHHRPNHRPNHLHTTPSKRQSSTSTEEAGPSSSRNSETSADEAKRLSRQQRFGPVDGGEGERDEDQADEEVQHLASSQNSRHPAILAPSLDQYSEAQFAQKTAEHQAEIALIRRNNEVEKAQLIAEHAEQIDLLQAELQNASTQRQSSSAPPRSREVKVESPPGESSTHPGPAAGSDTGSTETVDDVQKRCRLYQSILKRKDGEINALVCERDSLQAVLQRIGTQLDSWRTATDHHPITTGLDWLHTKLDSARSRVKEMANERDRHAAENAELKAKADARERRLDTVAADFLNHLETSRRKVSSIIMGESSSGQEPRHQDREPQG